MGFDLFTYLTSLAFIYVYGRLGIHFAPVIFSFFLNSPYSLRNQVEKPRLLFYILGLSLMHLMFLFSETIKENNILFQLLTLSIFSLGFLFCHITWTKKFKFSFVPKLKKGSATSSDNFNLSISDLHLTQLYNELTRFNLLNQDLTSFQDFRNVLLKNWGAHSSKIYLNMDGPSCREFYDCLIKTFPNNTMTLNSLITSKLFIRPDGKLYKYNTLKNAPTKTTLSKNHKALQQVFDKTE